MTNIDLYRKIRELVSKKFYRYGGYPQSFEQTKRDEAELRDEILHWMTIGEDSIKILEEDFINQKI